MPEFKSAPQNPWVQGGHADFMIKSDYLRMYPQAYAKFVRRYGGEFTFLDVLESIGRTSVKESKPHQSPFYDYFFKDEDTRTFTIGSVVTPQTDAGDDVVVALATSQMETINGKITSRPRKDETVQDKNGKNWSIVAKNTTVNPHQLTLRPKSETTAATFAANDTFFIIGPSYAEGTGQPKGLITDYGQYTNQFAIMKETDITTGTNMTTLQPWQPIKDLQGYAYLNGIEEAELRHKKNKAMMMIHGQLGDGNVTQYVPDFDVDAEANDTEGLIQAFVTSGKGFTYDESNGYDLDDFQRIISFYRNKRLPKGDILVLQGGDIASAVQTSLYEMFNTYNADAFLSKKYMSGLKYNANERYSAEDYFVEIGFKGFRKDGYNFLFRELTELNNLYGTGNTGYNYEGMQFFLPISVVRDPKNKIDLPTFEALHRGQKVGGYQRNIEAWNTGGAGPIRKTDEWDVQRTFLRSEFMLAISAHYWLAYNVAGATDGDV